MPPYQGYGERFHQNIKRLPELAAFAVSKAIDYGSSLGEIAKKERSHIAIAALAGVAVYQTIQARKHAKRAAEMDSLANRDHKFPVLHNNRAYVDSFTKLRDFYAHTKAGEQHSPRGTDKEALLHRHSLVMFDIDHFKQVNDTKGHPHGDKVLGQVAAIIAEHTRDEDLAFRYGGEELGVLLPHTDITGAVIVTQKIRKAVEAGTEVTVSAGVCAADMKMPPNENIAMADIALYDAKEAGRNRVEFYSQPTHGQMLQDKLRAAAAS